MTSKNYRRHSREELDTKNINKLLKPGTLLNHRITGEYWLVIKVKLLKHIPTYGMDKRYEYLLQSPSGQRDRRRDIAVAAMFEIANP